MLPEVDALNRVPSQASNPFSTRFFSPGTIPYQCFEGESVESLIAKFCNRLPVRASIIGPHGSGKSTLLATMIPILERQNEFSNVNHLRVNSDGNANRELRSFLRRLSKGSLFIIDGFEQLTALSRWLIELQLWRTSSSILITCHAPVSDFPILWRTFVDTRAEQFVISKLMDDNQEVCNRLFLSKAWAESRQRHQENLRESLFDMYDWWQNDHR